MYQRRENEPSYALLNDLISQTTNQYGNNINTVGECDALRGQSLNINNDPEIGDNPNRYKQHGFYFNADNCIACHACESACSEKNDVPSHVSFRSVGFIEGGTYPAYQRLNISMACNHCDDPVCLKGCPTRAYTKYAEYGAVLQDPDICFGCGYCTWVCPYNAPQLDPVKGEVSKCNMCVDRLEVGLKPACVSACLGNALDFGVVENTPENRTQTKTTIPGFPDTSITNPNIRFEQKRKPPRDLLRVDSTALKYHQQGNDGEFKPSLDAKNGFKRAWNLERLFGSHENAHILFTLTTQAVIGAFIMLLAGSWFSISGLSSLATSSAMNVLLPVLVIILTLGLYKLNMHLGKPHRFYRGFYNLKWSPVSREIAGVSLFFVGISAYTVLHYLNDLTLFAILQNVMGLVALSGALIGGFFMIKLYRIPARPFWNHWYTDASFISAALTLGAGLLAISSFIVTGSLDHKLLSGIILIGVLLESAALIAHKKQLQSATSEASASYYEQQTSFGKPFILRNVLLGILTVLTAITLFTAEFNSVIWPLIFIALIVNIAISRALFYVVVIPTTMPGAFFWKNKGFVEHARETGLADMPQMGVAYERHHKFDVAALKETITQTSLKEKIDQAKRVFTG